MNSGKWIQSQEINQPSGERHSITHQAFCSFLNAMRQSSQMQTMVSNYR